MNKKISTLLAAFLAAGFSYSAEAGVVKVTSVETGKTYVIADGEIPAMDGVIKAVTGENTTLNMVVVSHATTLEEKFLWNVIGNDLEHLTLRTGDTDGAGMTHAGSLGAETFGYAQAGAATDLQITAGSTIGRFYVKMTSGTNQFLDPTAVGTAKVSGTDLYFYGYSKTVDNATAVPFSVGGNYLKAKVDGTGTVTVETISATAYLALSDADKALANWTFLNGKASIFVGGDTYYLTAGSAWGVTTSLSSATVFEAFDGKAVAANAYLQADGTTSADPADAVAVSTSPADQFGVPSSVATDAYAGFKAASRLQIYNSGTGVATDYISKAGAQGAQVELQKAYAKTTTDVMNSFYWTINNNGTITNTAGGQLTVADETKFTVVKNATNPKVFALYVGSKPVTWDNSGALALGNFGDAPAVFSSVAPESNALKAEQLNNHLGNAFGLKFYDSANKNTSSIEGNVFTGKLTPMKWNSTDSKLVDAEDANDASGWYFLKRADGKYIVMDMDKDNIWTSAKVEGNTTYSFKAIKESALIEYLKGADKSAYKAEFQVSYADPNVYSESKMVPVYSIGVRESQANGTINYLAIVPYGPQYHGDYSYYLTAFQNELTDEALLKYKAYVEFAMDKVVLGTDKENNPLLHKYVNIAFANHSSVIYNTNEGRNTYANLNDKVLGVIGDGSDILPIDDNKVNFEKPEGQWAVVMTDMIDGSSFKKEAKIANVDESKFTFVNRESGAKYNVARMYHISGNKYAVEYDGTDKAFALGADKGQLTRDTLVIVKAETLKNDAIQQEGYFKETSTSLLDEQYRLAVASTDDVNFWVTENHYGKHFLGLSYTEANAANWRLVPMTVAREWDEDGDLVTVTDSVYIMNHPTVVSGDKFVSHNDTLGIISYVLQNTANGEYLTYESPKTTSIQQMICDPNSEKLTTNDLTAAYRFILKEKGNNKYNLIGVKDFDKEDVYRHIDLDNKLFGATTDEEGFVQVDYAYNRVNANDLFKVVKVEAPEYRKLAQGDTIRIFREENEYDTMYENGEFLNLGNTAQLKDMAPALYVDTAYVNRGHNNRYQYLLAVNPTRVDALPCDVEGHPAIHPDTTYGRFLVNLVDTAVYAYKNGAIHTNKYINDKEAGEPFVKLGFVWGFRTGDKLYVTKDNTFKKDSKRVIDLSTRDFNIAKFAFRFANPTDASDKSFKIQTRYVDYTSAITVKDQKDRAETNEGYLKTINGVVVVTSSYANGEVFNLAAEHSIPTANDDINVTSISISTREGEVIINGAQGKKVVITNVLGQTIANTVLSSDNATISAPAGIVVVAVEGEAAVKAIVK